MYLLQLITFIFRGGGGENTMFFAFLSLSWTERAAESLSQSPYQHRRGQNRNAFNLTKCNLVVEQEILRWSERILRCLL